jgi:hypothetical protein
MPALAMSEGKKFRLAAGPLFVFMFGLGMPLYISIVLFRYGTHMSWQPVLLGVAFMVPASVILSGLMTFMFPVKLSAGGIHTHNIWGVPCYIRWEDIKDARVFSLFNLRWLRLYPGSGGTVGWLALFQSPALAFKEEMLKLAPEGSPVRKYMK